MARSHLDASILIVALTWFCCCVSPSLAQQSSGISIAASAQSRDGKTVYYYTVTNNSAQRIVAFSVGSDYLHGISELTDAPNGWSASSGIAAGTVLSPSKWNASVISTEDSAAVEIEWRNDGTADLLPGTTLGGFALTVARPSAPYLNSHWTVIFGNSTVAFGTLTHSDSLPRPRKARQ